MRRLAILFIALLAPAYADTLTLRNGSSVTGNWVGLDAGQISFSIDGLIQKYARSDVAKVTFGGGGPAAPAPAAVPAPPAPAAPAADPKTISTGDSKDQVVAAYGQPERIAKSGTKEIYVYKNIKVTFVDGKVSDVQ